MERYYKSHVLYVLNQGSTGNLLPVVQRTWKSTPEKDCLEFLGHDGNLFLVSVTILLNSFFIIFPQGGWLSLYYLYPFMPLRITYAFNKMKWKKMSTIF